MTDWNILLRTILTVIKMSEIFIYDYLMLVSAEIQNVANVSLLFFMKLMFTWCFLDIHSCKNIPQHKGYCSNYLWHSGPEHRNQLDIVWCDLFYNEFNVNQMKTYQENSEIPQSRLYSGSKRTQKYGPRGHNFPAAESYACKPIFMVTQSKSFDKMTEDLQKFRFRSIVVHQKWI